MDSYEKVRNMIENKVLHLHEALHQYVVDNFGADQKHLGYSVITRGTGVDVALAGPLPVEVIWERSEPQPTEQQLDDALATYLANAYQRNRQPAYPAIGDQLDMLWHAVDGDEALKTAYADFHTAIKAIKDAHPKP